MKKIVNTKKVKEKIVEKKIIKERLKPNAIPLLIIFYIIISSWYTYLVFLRYEFIYSYTHNYDWIFYLLPFIFIIWIGLLLVYKIEKEKNNINELWTYFITSFFMIYTILFMAIGFTEIKTVHNIEAIKVSKNNKNLEYIIKDDNYKVCYYAKLFNIKKKKEEKINLNYCINPKDFGPKTIDTVLSLIDKKIEELNSKNKDKVIIKK